MDLQQIQEKYKEVIPVPIVTIAKELGIDVYETDEFKDDLSGSIKKEGENFAIYVNVNQSPWRKRFTIAHEIGHFLKHREKIDPEHTDTVKQPSPELHREDGVILSAEERKMEQEANEIAADILMPKDAFVREFEKATDIAEVAKKFGVSASAATVRALKLTNSFTN